MKPGPGPSEQPLEATLNPFGGMVASPESLPSDADEFRSRLHLSLDAWRKQGIKVAWLNAPISRAELVPIAVEAGFTYHHASDDYLLLTLRLQQGALIPEYASHYIGAGGVVLSDGSLLVVSEKHRRSPGRHYKLPGGALHTGEHLVDAVVREVLEETGVRTRFEAVVCMRNMHGYRHGKSDIYIVCRLTPLTFEIVIQPDEIEEALWMPVAEYLGSVEVSPFNKRIVEAAVHSPGLAPATVDGYGDPSKYEFFLPAELTGPPRSD